MKLRLIIAGLCLAAVGCGTSDSLEADAGPDFDVAVGESPTFDGCGSSGDIVNYQWVIRGAPPDMADDEGKDIREAESACSFTLEASMLADEVGAWTIELTVSDADGNDATDEVVVNVVG